jgi:hypothetical protein
VVETTVDPDEQSLARAEETHELTVTEFEGDFLAAAVNLREHPEVVLLPKNGERHRRLVYRSCVKHERAGGAIALLPTWRHWCVTGVEPVSVRFAVRCSTH